MNSSILCRLQKLEAAGAAMHDCAVVFADGETVRMSGHDAIIAAIRAMDGGRPIRCVRSLDGTGKGAGLANALLGVTE